MSFPRYERYKDSGVEWLGEVPEHWDSKRLILLASINDDALPEDTSPNFEMEYLDISSVTPGSRTLAGESLKFGSAPSRARRIVKNGDILVSTVRTYLRAIAPVVDPPDNLIASTGFAVVRPRHNISPIFLNYALQASNFIEEVIARSTGVSYPAINAHDLGFIRLPIPQQKQDQQHIGLFLETETAKIDALIEEQRRLIEFLKEKRQAVISHTVTKGLNAEAQMKDSGVEWMGTTPTHWRVMTLSRITLSTCDGPFGSGLKSDHYTDTGVRVIRLQNIRDGEFDGTEAAFIDPIHYATLGDHDVQGGDLLIAGLGDDRNAVGRACVAPSNIEPAMVKADCFRFRLSLEALPEFVAAQLSVGAPTDAGRLATGSTRSRIPVSKMSSRAISIPQKSEQMAIVEHLRIRDEEFTELRSQAALAVELLKERRSALISAAVTGKIDVRHYTPKEAA